MAQTADSLRADGNHGCHGRSLTGDAVTRLALFMHEAHVFASSRL